jgi:hypothetical protein
MSHTPFGYIIEEGKAIVNVDDSEKLKQIYNNYLAGDSLMTATKKAGLNLTHSSAGRLLKNPHYIGDDFYPKIIEKDIFEKVQIERENRAKKLGRLYERKKSTVEKQRVVFTHGIIEHKFENPIKQAEYAYSLIEIEV